MIETPLSRHCRLVLALQEHYAKRPTKNRRYDRWPLSELKRLQAMVRNQTPDREIFDAFPDWPTCIVRKKISQARQINFFR